MEHARDEVFESHFELDFLTVRKAEVKRFLRNFLLASEGHASAAEVVENDAKTPNVACS